MRTAEQGLDLFNSNIMGNYPEPKTKSVLRNPEWHLTLINFYFIEPLEYDEARREIFPRDDLIKLAGDDCRDLISACRKICHNLAIKESQTCISQVNGYTSEGEYLSEYVGIRV